MKWLYHHTHQTMDIIKDVHVYIMTNQSTLKTGIYLTCSCICKLYILIIGSNIIHVSKRILQFLNQHQNNNTSMNKAHCFTVTK